MQEQIEGLEDIWCLTCGMTSFTKSGFSSDGRQRVICKYCRTKSTVGGLRRGERRFDETKLLPILRKNASELTNKELYCLGVLVADGCLKRHDTISLMLVREDRELIEIVHRELQIPSNIREYTRKRKGRLYHSIEISWQYKFSEKYWNDLGIFSQKTGQEVWLSHMNSPDFVRGYLDGDGCFFFDGDEGRLSFTCLCKSFLESLNSYLKDAIGVGIQTPYFINRKETNTYGLRFRRKEARAIGDFIYNNSEGIRLERKYIKYLEIKDSLHVDKNVFYRIQAEKSGEMYFITRGYKKYLEINKQNKSPYLWKTKNGVEETLNRLIPKSWSTKYNIPIVTYKEFYTNLGYSVSIEQINNA